MIADGANLDGEIIMQTVYQYMLYQEQLNRIDPELIKIAINVIKEKAGEEKQDV